MKNRIQIPAIHDKNLKKVLDDLSLSKQIDNHEQFCINCSEVITLDNIAGLKVKNGVVRIVCSNPECLATITNEPDISNG